MEPIIKLTRIKFYKCNKCTKVFTCEENLEKHSKMHIHILSTYVPVEKKVLKCEPFDWFQTSKECGLLEKSQAGPRKSKRFKNDKEKTKKAASPILYPDDKHTTLKDPGKHAVSIGERFENLTSEEDTPLIKYIKTESDKTKLEKDVKTLLLNCTKPGNEPNMIVPSTQTVKSETQRKKKTKNHIGLYMSIKKEDRSYICLKCTESFSNEIDVYNHNKTVHVGEKFSCEPCKKVFARRSGFLTHYNNKHCSNVVCPSCGKGFGSQSVLKKHLDVHMEKKERPYICGVCNRGFSQAVSVRVHHRRIHARIKDQICQYCTKAFPDRGSLARHVRSHTGDKPYKCIYCIKDFSDPSAFQRHIRTHTGDKRYACPKCPMKFSDASGLIAHKVRHSNIRKFNCNGCEKAFFTFASMMKHVKIVHLGIKLFECHYCGMKVSVKSNLQNHIYSVHLRTARKNKEPNRA